MHQRDRAYIELRRLITEGEMRPGQPLPEAPVARRLGVSRTPTRDALNRLIRDGLVTQTPGRTAVVSTVSINDVIAQFQAREALEVYAMQLAARSQDRHEFREVGAAFGQAAERLPTDSDEIYRLVADFERLVEAASRSHYIADELTELRGHLVRLRRLMRDDHDRLRISAAQHRDIADAIAAGDENRVAETASRWLRDSLDTIISILTSGLLGDSTRPRIPLHLG